MCCNCFALCQLTWCDVAARHGMMCTSCACSTSSSAVLASCCILCSTCVMQALPGILVLQLFVPARLLCCMTCTSCACSTSGSAGMRPNVALLTSAHSTRCQYNSVALWCAIVAGFVMQARCRSLGADSLLTAQHSQNRDQTVCHAAPALIANETACNAVC